MKKYEIKICTGDTFIFETDASFDELVSLIKLESSDDSFFLIDDAIFRASSIVSIKEIKPKKKTSKKEVK